MSQEELAVVRDQFGKEDRLSKEMFLIIKEVNRGEDDNREDIG